MSTRQKCNPEYIPLYLRSEMNSLRSSWPAVWLNRPCQKVGEFEEIQRTWIVGKEFERSSDFRTTQFSKRIKMESQVHFDLENFFRIKILNVSEETSNFNMRVWSWLRMNAGGVPNTCKSNGRFEKSLRMILKVVSGGRVSNAWGTCLCPGDSSWKRLVIPHTLISPHGGVRKDLSVKDGSASD